jgi:hypothetical protein
MPTVEPLRYCVLHHTGIPEPHFDLLIETSKKAKVPTWRFPVWPIDQPTRVRRLQDHRRRYLWYSGEIGGDRGSVAIKDFGTHRTERRRGHWIVQFLMGQRSARGVELTQLKGEMWEARPLRRDPSA